MHSLPSKEMLVDPKHGLSATSDHSSGSTAGMDFFNQKMEEMGHDLMMRKMGTAARLSSLPKMSHQY